MVLHQGHTSQIIDKFSAIGLYDSSTSFTPIDRNTFSHYIKRRSRHCSPSIFYGRSTDNQIALIGVGLARLGITIYQYTIPLFGQCLTIKNRII